jgi:hypothetical protein
MLLTTGSSQSTTIMSSSSLNAAGTAAASSGAGTRTPVATDDENMARQKRALRTFAKNAKS